MKKKHVLFAYLVLCVGHWFLLSHEDTRFFISQWILQDCIALIYIQLLLPDVIIIYPTLFLRVLLFCVRESNNTSPEVQIIWNLQLYYNTDDTAYEAYQIRRSLMRQFIYKIFTLMKSLP